jgi:hypothetical protein
MTQSEQQQQRGDGEGVKKLTVIHYNDVYNIDTQGNCYYH